MHQIKPHALWVGNAGDGRNFPQIFAHGIRAIVQLAIEEPPVQPPRELIYQRFPLLDGEGNGPDVLRLAIDAVARLIEAELPTLVCCGAGMSRSPVIVATALAVAFRADFEQSFQTVVQHFPADISPALLAEVQAILKEPE
ncbi:MAG: dual specificity protein phosphatase family protein [Planctomycetia bacterium]|nr:dual specificity protein phosphatase family protein [Planctomycetia bacterium]